MQASGNNRSEKITNETTIIKNASDPNIEILDNGNIAVVYVKHEDYDFYYQLWDNLGGLIKNETEINWISHNGDNDAPTDSKIAEMPNGNFVVVFRIDRNGDDNADGLMGVIINGTDGELVNQLDISDNIVIPGSPAIEKYKG